MDYNEAFLNTNYVLNDDKHPLSSYIFRIGKPYKEISDWMKRHNHSSWCMLTAWNPLPEVLTEEENNKRNYSLELVLKMHDLKYYNAYGQADDDEWQEHGFWILDCSFSLAESIASDFKQLAYLYGDLNGKTELIYSKEI